MEWWFVVIYVSFLLAAFAVVSSTQTVPGVWDHGCALSGDAASIHDFPSISSAGCAFSGDHVGPVRLLGSVTRAGDSITYVWVGG